MTPTLHIDSTGMCCAVGTSTALASAAIRAGMDHFCQTPFWDFADKPLVGAMVTAREAKLPLGDLVQRAGLLFGAAAGECLSDVPPQEYKRIPLLLLTAEPERPGLPDNWGQNVFTACTEKVELHPASRICTWGKAGLGLALPYARQLLEADSAHGGVKQVLVVGVDTLFCFATLMRYLQERRLITGYNSDGFLPGEGAGAVLLSKGRAGQGGVHITGVGYGEEPGHRLQTERPNRAEGMTRALRMATAECGHKLTETQFHYSDCSGEAFFVKEVTHALMRCFEHTIPTYPHLLAGSTLGETGAAVGPLLLAQCTQILGREDGIGSRVLLHFSADSGKCAAVIAEHR